MSTFARIFVIAIGIAISLEIVLRHRYRRQTKTPSLPARFEEAAAAFNLSISKQEVLGKRMIGLDEGNNKVHFLEANEVKHDGYLVSLDEIKECTVAITADRLDDSTLASYVNRVELRLDYINGANSTFLTFYNKTTNEESEMWERLEQAKEWQKLLSMPITEKYNKVEKCKAPAKRMYVSIINEAAPLARIGENTASYNSR